LLLRRCVRLITGQFDAVNLKESVVNKLLGSTQAGNQFYEIYKIDPASTVNNQTDQAGITDAVTENSLYSSDGSQQIRGSEIYQSHRELLQVHSETYTLDEILPVDSFYRRNEWGSCL
jgi:hypothetical protein